MWLQFIYKPRVAFVVIREVVDIAFHTVRSLKINSDHVTYRGESVICMYILLINDHGSLNIFRKLIYNCIVIDRDVIDFRYSNDLWVSAIRSITIKILTERSSIAKTIESKARIHHRHHGLCTLASIHEEIFQGATGHPKFTGESLLFVIRILCLCIMYPFDILF